MSKYKNFIYNSFKEINGYVLTGIGFIITFLFWIYKPTDTISYKIFIPTIVTFVILLIIFLKLSYSLYQNNQNILPKVIRGINPPKFQKGAKALLLLNKSEIFSQDALVTVFHNDEGYERYIGSGFVLSIQEDGIIQVIVFESLDNNDKTIWDKVTSNESLILEKIIIKPTIQRTMLDQNLF